MIGKACEAFPHEGEGVCGPDRRRMIGLLYDKNDETTLIPEVELGDIERYKREGVIAGGMLPKIEGMADAIRKGVREAVIIDGRVPHSILLEMFSDRGAGTMFYRQD